MTRNTANIEKYKYWIAAGTVFGAILIAVGIFLIVHFTKPAPPTPTPTPTNVPIPTIVPEKETVINIDLGGVSAQNVGLFGPFASNFGYVFGANNVHDNYQTTLPTSERFNEITTSLAQYDGNKFITVGVNSLIAYEANPDGQMDSVIEIPPIDVNTDNFCAGSLNGKEVIVSLVPTAQTMQLRAWDHAGNEIPQFGLDQPPSTSSLFLHVMCSSQQNVLHTCVVDITRRIAFVSQYDTKQSTQIITLTQSPISAAFATNGTTLVLISQQSIFVYRGISLIKQWDMNFVLRNICVTPDGSRFAVSTSQTSIVLGSDSLRVYQPSFRDTNGPIACLNSDNSMVIVICDSRVTALLAQFTGW